MIWDGKRYKGVHVYVGRQDGEEPGDYIIVYKCNGITIKHGEAHYDAIGTLMTGHKFPDQSTSVHAAYLHKNFREVSQRKIPLEDQKHLAHHVTRD